MIISLIHNIIIITVQFHGCIVFIPISESLAVLKRVAIQKPRTGYNVTLVMDYVTFISRVFIC